MVSAVSFLSVSHEYIVPDLEILAAMAAWLTVGAASFTACIDEHLTVRAARSCFTCRSPPVVFTRHEIDSFLWYSKALPLCSCNSIPRNLIVPFKYCNAEFIHWDVKNLCHELEGILDHLFFEVISKRPVAKHFEECKVVWVTYAVDVPGSDTLLIIAESLSCRMVCTKEVWNQRMHSSCCEKNRRVILRNQGSATDLLMTFGDEKINILFP